jgi:hypothetical protein
MMDTVRVVLAGLAFAAAAAIMVPALAFAIRLVIPPRRERPARVRRYTRQPLLRRILHPQSAALARALGVLASVPGMEWSGRRLIEEAHVGRRTLRALSAYPSVVWDRSEHDRRRSKLQMAMASATREQLAEVPGDLITDLARRVADFDELLDGRYRLSVHDAARRPEGR